MLSTLSASRHDNDTEISLEWFLTQFWPEVTEQIIDTDILLRFEAVWL